MGDGGGSRDGKELASHRRLEREWREREDYLLILLY